MTATQIADAAGISRRTLFNYFPTVDAILSYPLHSVLESMVDSITELTDQMPLIEAIVQALKSDEVAQMLGQVALFGARLQQDVAAGSYAPNMLEWHKATTEVIHKVANRYPHADAFSVRVFTHALLGAGQAAFDEWIEQLPPSYRSGPDLNDELIAKFHLLITRAMRTLDEGLTSLPFSPSPDSQED